MKKLILIIMFLQLPVLTTSLLFADDAFERLMSAKSLKCEFGSGSYADWKGSKAKVKKDNFDATIIYDSIDLKTSKARMIGNAGSIDVVVLATGTGLTFIEETGAGNIHITTVFASYAKGTKDFIVVTSRHLMFISKPLPSQYHGTCKVWE